MNFEKCSKKDFYAFLKSKSDEYYNLGQISVTGVTVSDEEFDNLVQLYELRFDEQFTYLGSKGEVKLPVYMGSLDKIKDEKGIQSFVAKCGKNNFVISDKIDGLSLLIHYRGGKPIAAFTRGDGFSGTDVTQLLRYVDYNVSKINVLDDVFIRGEIVMELSIFNKWKSIDSSLKNARNTVCGLVNSKDKNVNMLKDLKFIAYAIYGTTLGKTNVEMFNALKKFGFYTPHFELVKGLNKDGLQSYLQSRKSSADYEMDGLVITSLEIHDEPVGENPTFTIAFKMQGETLNTVVKSVEWSVTKHKVLKPVINIEPIQLSGVTISNTTGFNARFIKDNGIGPGAIVQMTRSGDVIPYIVNVVKRATPSLPTRECVWNETEVDLLIEGEESGEVWIKRMICLFETTKIKGVKEGVLKMMFSQGITSEHHLFNVTKSQLLQMEGIKEKSAQNIISAIDECRNKVDLKVLLITSCIFQGFGESKIDKILSTIGGIKEILTTNVNFEYDILEKELKQNGFNKTAQTFLDAIPMFREYYHSVSGLFPNLSLTQRTIVTPESEELQLITPTLGTFCLSGFRDKKLSEMLIQKGYKEDSDVKKTTSFLIVLEDGAESGKTKKAEKYGVKIIKKEEINKII